MATKRWADYTTDDDDEEPSYARRVAPIPESHTEKPIEKPFVDPGTPIGLREIQTILMSATQSNLSHFHTAGMESTITIRPSIIDCFDSIYNSKNTSMSCILPPEEINNFRKHIVYSKLQDFVLKIKSTYSNLSEHENIWYECCNKKPASDFIRFYFNYNQLKKFNLTLDEIGNKCFKKDEWYASPDFMGMLDVTIKNNKISHVLSKMDTHVCGIENIKTCTFSNAETRLMTHGSDILNISKILHNNSTLRSNNVSDVEKYFGIEAAASVLKDLIGSEIVSDFMCRTGSIIGFHKHSIEVKQKDLLFSLGLERPKPDIINELISKKNTNISTYHNIMTGKSIDTLFKIDFL